MAHTDHTIEKGVANGLATLDGSTKVPVAQITGVLASSDLTNDAALEKVANKGAANGYASLDASSLVVQNPASANVTPGNATIPIADANGDLDVGYVPDRVGRWVKVTKVYTDFSTNGATNDIEIFSLPASGTIHAVVIKHTVAFDATGLSQLVMSVGVAGNLTKYASGHDVFTAVSDTNFSFNELPGMENFGAATSIRALAVATGAFLDALTAGSVDFYIHYSVLP